jgi:hypothetical protein
VPRGPKGEKRPADVVSNAVHVMRIATGEIEDRAPTPEEQGKDPAAAAMGRKGGAARAKTMNAEERSRIARRAAHKRWHRDGGG